MNRLDNNCYRCSACAYPINVLDILRNYRDENKQAVLNGIERLSKEQLVRYSKPLLFLAVECEDSEIVRAVLSELKQNLDSTLDHQPYYNAITPLNGSAHTPLEHAILLGKHTAASLLIEECPQEILMEKNLEGETPLHLALKNEESYVALQLIQRLPREVIEPLLIQDKDGNTPIYLAMDQLNDSVASVLVERFSLDALSAMRNAKGQSPLHYAICREKRNIAQRLISEFSPKQLSIQDNDGNTPLHLAQIFRRRNIATALIEKMEVKDLSIQNRQGMIPLHLAIYGEDFQNATRMIEKLPTEAFGIQNKFLETPLNALLSQQEDVEIATEEFATVGRLLIERSSSESLSKKSLSGTPLQLILRFMELEDLTLELIKKLNPEDFLEVDSEADTPLHVEMNYGGKEIASALIGRMPQKVLFEVLRKKNVCGDSPLHSGIFSENLPRDEFLQIFSEIAGKLSSRQMSEILQMKGENDQGIEERSLAYHVLETFAEIPCEGLEKGEIQEIADFFDQIIPLLPDEHLLTLEKERADTFLHLAFRNKNFLLAHQLSMAFKQKMRPEEFLKLFTIADEENTTLLELMLNNEIEEGESPFDFILQQFPLIQVEERNLFIFGKKEQGMTGIQKAISDGKFQVVRNLVKWGATVLFVDPRSLQAIAASKLGIGVLPPDHEQRKAIEEIVLLERRVGQSMSSSQIMEFHREGRPLEQPDQPRASKRAKIY